ncbi:hypothetical protein C341T2LP_00081 [Bacteroides phage C3_41T2LP]|nr:hypothetical protein C341T2LP_00081 [Bacteroides phage C3_41T2LP]
MTEETAIKLNDFIKSFKNLISESEITNAEFSCRGKVTVTLSREEPKSVEEIYRNGVKIDKEE